MKRMRRFGLAAVLLILTGAGAWGYAFLGSKWSEDTVVMHLQLGSSGRLIDGSASWNVAAENALAIWNEYLSRLEFRVVRNSSSTPGDGDDVNNVFFASSVYGFSFSGAVAVTTEWTRNGGARRIEADVIFNSALDWNSYRGDLQRSSDGNTLYDLRRVALHEFGHVLGLDHPNERGQSVVAIMNSRVSDIDNLRPDDIRGGQALYGARQSRERASFTRPSRNSFRTSAARYQFRGKADVSRADAVYLVNDRLGSRRFFKASGLSTWRRSLSLRPGRNVIRLYIQTLAGSRVKVTQCTVTRPAD